MRLIDADALKRELDEAPHDGTIARYVYSVISDVLDKAPTIDAVIRKRESRKMLPCLCGYNKREHGYDSNGVVYLVCKRCEFTVCGKNEIDAIRNWNKAVSRNETD